MKLVIKPYPTISNSFIMGGEENEVNRQKYIGTWYYERKYLAISKTDEQLAGEPIYDFIIASWWVMAFGLIIYLIFARVSKSRRLKILSQPQPLDNKTKS